MLRWVKVFLMEKKKKKGRKAEVSRGKGRRLFWFLSFLPLKDLHQFSTEQQELVTAGLQRLTLADAEMSELTVTYCHWRRGTRAIGTKISSHNIPRSDTAGGMAPQCSLPVLCFDWRSDIACYSSAAVGTRSSSPDAARVLLVYASYLP